MKICPLLRVACALSSPGTELFWNCAKPVTMPLTDSLPNGPASKVAGGSHCSGPVRTNVESGAGAAAGVGTAAGVAAGGAAGVAACATCVSAGAEELETSLAAYEAAVKAARMARTATWRTKRWEFVGIIMGVSLSSQSTE
jgi:hypothetical protein